MLKDIFSKKNYPFLFLDVFLLFSCFFFVDDSFGRFLFLFFSILLYIFLSYYLKNRIVSSLLYILITLPFNITYQLPQIVKILGSTFTLYDAYVNGVSVNYLIPTVSIVDLGFFILFYSLIFSNSISFSRRIISRYRFCFFMILLFFGIDLLFNMSVLQVFHTLRILVYLFAFIWCIHWIIENRRVFSKKIKTYFWFVIFVLVCIQGSLACMQFSKGISLGLNFLGESNVVSGMAGSSFIELDNRLFLRGYGTFPHPNVLAGFFLFSFLFSLTMCLREKGLLRVLGSISMVVSIVFSVFSFSRVAIFLIAFDCFGILGGRIYSRLLKGKSFSMYFVPLEYLCERFANIFNSGDRSFSERIELVKCSFRIIKENILFGCGLGNFVRAMEGFVPRSKNGIMILQPVHNIFLLSLSEMGIFGFVSFWFTLVKVLFSVIERFNVMVLMVILDILVVGSFDHYLLDLPQGLGLFILLLMLCVVNSFERNKRNSRKKYI